MALLNPVNRPLAHRLSHRRYLQNAFDAAANPGFFATTGKFNGTVSGVAAEDAPAGHTQEFVRARLLA